MEKIKQAMRSIPRSRCGVITRTSKDTVIYYTPIEAMVDTEELASLGRRVIFVHGSPYSPDSRIILADKDVLTFGVVLGITD